MSSDDPPANPRRPIGLFKGQFVVPEDFNDPLPDWLQRAFDGDEIDYTREAVTWTKTGDSRIPYEAIVEGHPWQIRSNQAPESPMYTLFIDGWLVIELDEWPVAWTQ